MNARPAAAGSCRRRIGIERLPAKVPNVFQQVDSKQGLPAALEFYLDVRAL